ncbi:BSD-domain-containing protein [Macroventuria anomochaeta]|uniref:BSD-domain-containing protein n=1 Tax=Macroventuria anomochaeta TaxID=301207 RepID=A0ACB6RRQ5_9PLEO|nr:BSD-domain-containing protein [Macroventuria anomochaeta]KAF2624586.1 BSD-domain-containing protein [Macroventuria anomochaeta]
MDSAYDHIQEESYSQDQSKKQTGESSSNAQPSNFNTEVQEAYKAISSSPWAAKLGGFWQTAKKQGEQYYDTASKQYASTSKEATVGVSTLISHARNLSVQANDATTSTAKDAPTEQDASKEDMTPHPDRPESLTADIVKEAEGILSLFRSNASKRLKELQKAEDAADEALLKFGSNIRNFLSEAVSIAPPASGSQAEKDGAVLFESKDSSGKKVVHATRFDAQLHVIHSSLDSFLKDPASPQWEAWKKSFDAEKKTDAIAKDLEKHEELRTAMEKVVPEKVDYATFWCRYYFLRHVIESEEQRRREMLKASAPADEEEVDWSSGSESESDDDVAAKSTAKPTTTAAKPSEPSPKSTSTSDLTKSQTTIKPETESDTLKPAQPRRSNDEKSVADSDASYDLVSGATSRAPSRAPGSPKGKASDTKVVEEESEDDDWE